MFGLFMAWGIVANDVANVKSIRKCGWKTGTAVATLMATINLMTVAVAWPRLI